MKKTLLTTGTLAAALVLSACGEDNNGLDISENEMDATNTGQTDDNSPQSQTETEDDEEDENDFVGEGNDDVDGEVEDNEEESDEGNEEAASDWYEDLNFYEFDLDVDYGDQEYEAEYEYNDGTPEAQIEDSRDGDELSLTGEGALEELEGPLTELDLDADSSDDEVMDQVMNAFGIEEGYEEFEVEIEFFDDDELEVEDEE
ncbi:YusW family protein [Alkalicoccus luteus]|uniref:YusW family protein n=1 Tax=Alkalicoccus luteus TaxID=1237094 RepID=UPI0040341335